MSVTLILGASTNPDRYSHKAVLKLQKHNLEVAALGFREGEINGVPILTGFPELRPIDTISIYMGAERQKDYYSYILSLKPRRVIFNPGAENPDFYPLCEANGIRVVEDCMFIMINTNIF